ncbi:hypothetical protein ACFPVT_02300 [Corynebacterium choanae]|uniref:hypothetical protein n=1 Tax=Corynebacterium choanae TaxID=1862358 RepID=UPI000F4FD6EB|nr:hypothetical protein [Corynebacterium choanae]
MTAKRANEHLSPGENSTASSPWVPAPVRIAGQIAVGESLVVMIYALVLIVRDVLGYRDPAAVFASGYESRAAWLGIGTAICLLIMFGAVAWAGWAYWHGKRIGRGLVFFANILFLPVAYYIAQAGAWIPAIIVGLIAVITIGLLVHPAAVGWMQAQYPTRNSQT